MAWKYFRYKSQMVSYSSEEIPCTMYITSWWCMIFPPNISRFIYLPQSKVLLQTKTHELSIVLFCSVFCGGWINLVFLLGLPCSCSHQSMVHLTLPSCGSWTHVCPENQCARGRRSYSRSNSLLRLFVCFLLENDSIFKGELLTKDKDYSKPL